MSIDLKQLQVTADQSGIKAKEYLESTRLRAYSSGKSRIKEVIQDVQAMEELIDQVEEETGMFSTCRKGCTACCHQIVVASQFESELILRYIDHQYDEETKQAIKQRIKKAAEQLDLEFGPTPSDQYGMKTLIREQEENKKRYFELNLPCPLLSDEGSCMAYPVRPPGCWSYRNYGDPVACETSHDIPTTIGYIGMEHILSERKGYSIRSGSVPKYTSYHLTGFLPQKLNQLL